METNDLDLDEQKNREELSKTFQLKKMARNIFIPTNDSEVKQILRDLGSPICFFGEIPIDRAERLKKLIGDMIMRDGMIPNLRKFNEEKKSANLISKPEENEIFYTEGCLELKNIRIEIAKFSLPRSSCRIEISKKKFMEIDRIQETLDYQKYLKKAKNYNFVASQFADERGCTKGCISPDDKYYGVAGTSNICTILGIFF